MEQVLYYFTHLFSTEGLPPRWLCGVWSPFQGWFYILSDLAIFAAYFTIPFLILYIMKKRKSLPFSSIFIFFAAFIFACGSTHLLDALMFWWPAYRFSGLVYFLTALISWATIAACLPVLPQALELKDHDELNALIAERTHALEVSQNELMATFNNAAVGIAHASLDGHWLKVNPMLSRILGYSEEELKQLTFQSITYAEDKDKHVPYIQRLLMGESPAFSIRKRYVRKDQSLVWVSLSVSLMRKPSGEPAFFIAVIQDISQTMQMEQDSMEAERRFRLMVDSVQDYAIYQEDMGGHITSWNTGAKRIYGYSGQEICGKLFSLFLPPDEIDAGRVEEELQIATTQGRFEHEGWRFRKDGSRFWANKVLTPLFDSRNQQIGFSNVTRDLTERWLSEESLQASVKELRDVKYALDVSAIVAITDVYGIISYVNEAFEKISKYSREELIGKTHRVINSGYHPKSFFVEMWNTIHSGQVWKGEVRNKAKDGTFYWVDTTIVPILDKDTHKPYQFVAIRYDITSRKTAEEAIRLMNAELELRVQDRTAKLEAINKELETFSYSVSHDLRAPLRSIDGFSNLLLQTKEEQLDDEGKEYLHLVRDSAKHMATLIDDLLNLSRLSRAELRKEKLDLSVMVEGVLNQLQIEAPERTVKVHVQPVVSAYGDPGLLQAALQNLLSNAWKFSGEKDKAVIEFGTQLQNDKTVYFVRDNGAGFDMTYAGKLFGAFQRLHDQDEFPGTGVGLATVQRIIHRHGGDIWAESEINQGATFYFTLSGREGG